MGKSNMYKASVRGLAFALGLTTLTSCATAKPKELSDLVTPQSAYAQSNIATTVDYDGLAKRAEKLHYQDKNKEILIILQPYENDQQNKSADFFNVLGIAYRYNNKPLKAENAFLKARELKPLDNKISVNLGVLYLKNFKDRKKAEEQFLYVIEKIDKNDAAANFYLKAMKEGRF